jgi:undecaprenyl-diphosphatase
VDDANADQRYRLDESATMQGFFRVRVRPTRTQLVVVAVVCVSVAALTSLAARNGDVTRVEAAVLRWFNGWPDAVEPIMWIVQQAGVLFAPIVVGVVVAIVARRWTLVVPFVLVLPLKLLLEKGIVKSLIERERPYVSYGQDIVVRGGAFEGLSFPSGHTTTAFATAVLLVALLPRRWRPVPIVWAVLVGAARMYMGEHNFYDVIAGAALGTMFGTVLWFAVLANDHIGGPVEPDGEAVTTPPPGST